MKIVTQTNRLILREYTPEDISILYPIVSDPVTMSFYPEPFSLEKATAWIERSLKSYAENGFGRYAVLLRETEEFIGCAGYFVTEVNGKTETDLGYILAKEHWGNGYASEAAKACIELAREHGWTRRIVIQMAHDHIASRRVAEHVGATLETTFHNPKNRSRLTNLFVIVP